MLVSSISFSSSQIFDARLADQHMIDEGKKNAICMQCMCLENANW